MATIEESATVTGTRLAETLNRIYPTWHLTAQEAFLYTYGGSVSFRKTGTACAQGCWGQTFLRDGVHEIDVYTNADLASGDARWGVHELGHAFVNTGVGRPVFTLELNQLLIEGFPNRPMSPNDPLGTWGFKDVRWGWQRSDQGSASEEFADMYLGWVYNEWESISPNSQVWTEFGQMRADFMDIFMPLWVDKNR